MNKQEVIGNALAAVAVICAVITTSLFVRREFLGDPRGRSQKPVLVANARDYAIGHRFGAANAAVTVVEFSDFECPFCKHFAESTWSVVQRRFPNKVALVFRHWPLTAHKQAYAAARAAECAAEQGRFAAFHDVLFAKQDSLGIKPYSEFAGVAGVPDLAAFAACNARGGKVPSIERDIAAARRVQARGTPTIIVNDKRFTVTPSAEQLIAVIAKEVGKTR